jgi:predicted esterase
VKQHRLSVARSARYWTRGGAGREPWIVLHGYGQLAENFLETCAPLDDGRRLLVAPEGLSRFYLQGPQRQVGASWMTRQDRDAEIHDYLRLLDAVWRDVREREGLDGTPHVLGFSQGAATAARWAALGEGEVARLVLWGGDVPPDLDLADSRVADRLRGVALTLVAGQDDEYVTEKILARDGARLDAAGIPFRVVRFAGGHVIPPDVLRDVARAPTRGA